MGEGYLAVGRARLNPSLLVLHSFNPKIYLKLRGSHTTKKLASLLEAKRNKKIAWHSKQIKTNSRIPFYVKQVVVIF